MDDLLKANFKVKNPVKADAAKETPEESHKVIAKELRKRALASLSGSMVYVERDKLTWDGEDESEV